ncbi:MAG: CDP-alcohol phosphatidyltransferase family protein [Treponema sp.]|nr:CDP-alcohol phosphatidyltransferase family protein [Treponema sp.]
METAKALGPVRHLPNILSGFRIAGALALPFLIRNNWERTINLPFISRSFPNVPVVWLIFYLLILSTDKLDGTIARKLKAESALGAALDSIADVLVLAIGATLCFTHFVRDSLEDWRFKFYIGIMLYAVFNRLIVFLLAHIYHGKANATHSYFQKGFAISCYIAIFFWAFLRTIPAWSIYALIALSIYATIDEGVYCARVKNYDINFKGHGFEKYEKRIS